MLRPLPQFYRWIICLLLFLATSIIYADRQILSLLKDTLEKEFGMSNITFGIIAAVFNGSYAIGLLGFGWFVDRYGTKTGYFISILAWSLAAMGHFFVASVSGFYVARVFLGLGEGGNFPNAIKLIGMWFSPKERMLATTIFNAGSNVGALIAPALIPVIAAAWGWRSPFVVAGITGLFWLGLWSLLYRPAPQLQPSDSSSTTTREPSIPWWTLMGYRQTWSFIFAKALTDPIWWFYLTWLPDYFSKTRHLDIKHSWIHLFTIYLIVTVLSIFGGWLAGRLIQSGLSVTATRKISMMTCAACVLPVFFVTWVGDWQAVLLIGLAAAAHQTWSATIFTTVSDMFPKHGVASVVGIGGMAGSVASMAFPIFTGAVLDAFSKNSEAGYTLLFGICSCAYVVAFVINNFLAPTFHSIKEVPSKSLL